MNEKFLEYLRVISLHLEAIYAVRGQSEERRDNILRGAFSIIEKAQDEFKVDTNK